MTASEPRPLSVLPKLTATERQGIEFRARQAVPSTHSADVFRLLMEIDRLAEEPPAQLNELLDDFNVAINWYHAPIEDFEDTDQCPYATREEAEAAIRAARAALVGLYERQQEELEQEHVSYAHEYNWRVSLESQLERLKAEQITPQLAAEALRLMPYASEKMAVVIALRRLSHSDQPK